jgi:hypothetical protein
MKRPLTFSITLFALTISVAHAVPIRPLYEPPNRDTEPLDFRGTVWDGKTYEGGALRLKLEPNGILNYDYQGNKSTAGSWNSDGNILYFEMNQRYLEFRGSRIGNTIDGDTWNVTGLRWKTHLKLALPAK